MDNGSAKGQFKDFIKTVVNFTDDLSSLTCPTFFLNGLSLLEYGTYWGDHPKCFSSIGEADDPLERTLLVVRWFMSTLYGSYASRCTNGQNEKKPYNPILGEQFHCTLGDVKCVCEQVCHHPPISAFYLEDTKAGVSLNGHSGQKSKFKGTSIRTQQVGRAVLYLKSADEKYLINYPDLWIRGFITGAAYIELGGTCTISSTSGIKAEITFLPKPWFRGEHHHIKGEIKDSEGQVKYVLSGRWSNKSYYAVPEGTPKLLFDADEEEMAERVTAPIEEQKEIESHRLWGPVSEALKNRDFKTATAEKNRIEDWQRKIRKEREVNQETWHPTLFHFVDDENPTSEHEKAYIKLKGDVAGESLLGNGAWIYNDQLPDRA